VFDAFTPVEYKILSVKFVLFHPHEYQYQFIRSEIDTNHRPFTLTFDTVFRAVIPVEKEILSVESVPIELCNTQLIIYQWRFQSLKEHHGYLATLRFDTEFADVTHELNKILSTVTVQAVLYPQLKYP
jgi:hypothetical protein